MSHPCADHIATCDHCVLCEAGVCCAGLSAEQRAQLLALIQSERQAARLQEAVSQEAQRTFSLAELMQIEAERQVIGAPPLSSGWSALPMAVADLPAAQRLGLGAPADVSLSHSSKEAARVLAARSTR